MSNASVAAELILTRPRRKSKELVGAILDLRDSREPSAKQIDAALNELFQLAILRQPTAEEPKKYAGFLAKNQKSLGNELGLHTTLTAVLLHPESIYRLETVRGTADAQGRIMLAPRVLADAIAYALTEQAPDAELLRAVQAGELKSREQVGRQVARLLADETTMQYRILQFFREYFGYTAAPEVFKDEKTLKEAGIAAYWPEALPYDTDHLALLILRDDRDVLKELLTTRRGYVDYLRGPDFVKGKPPVAPAPKRHVGTHYNYDSDTWSPFVPVAFPAQQRAGILTQPSWLIAHSTNFDNHAIERGKWIRERLLGGTLPDVPITVEAKLPDDPQRTLRQRMEVTRQTFCWQCHQKMNPLGLPFEQFDHFGRYRTDELGKPVDTSGEIVAGGDPKLDGPVKNAFELLERLAGSERVQQVFVRHAFRFWMGRNETPADAPILQEAYRAYRDGGGSMKALVTSLLTSDAFLYRFSPQAKR